ncbi:MAG: radical SAM protein [Gloeocapsa sp. DLM2.Bin57]|nr:MAG: radical SAM protein [Gloeocapsa sp. DLM2.Bin57]
MSQKDSTLGFIHSTHALGTVDGPGLRFLVFLQGCLLKCVYCHNPDSIKLPKLGKSQFNSSHKDKVLTSLLPLNGTTYSQCTASELFAKIKKYKGYLTSCKGGITISGGEPLVQADFVVELLQLCKQEGIHSAIDTSGFLPLSKTQQALKLADLVLMDLKAIDADIYKKITSVNIQPSLNTINFLKENQIPTWIRFVLVPNLNDGEEHLHKIGKFLKNLEQQQKFIEKFEVLPFHQMGAFKWEELGEEYLLKDFKEANQDDLKRCYEIVNQYVNFLV